jgi:hypothetical protein
VIITLGFSWQANEGESGLIGTISRLKPRSGSASARPSGTEPLGLVRARCQKSFALSFPRAAISGYFERLALTSLASPVWSREWDW